MVKTKKLLIIITLLSLLMPAKGILNPQNINPILSVNSVEPQQRSQNNLSSLSFYQQITGNIFYLLIINSSFVFPQNSLFTGNFLSNCGMAISLVNSSAWQVINFRNFCPGIALNSPISAGTYNFTLYYYINTLSNYTNVNFPKMIGFYIYSEDNIPQYRSKNYSINLGEKITNFNQPLGLYNTKNNSFANQILYFLTGMIFISTGTFVIVEYVRYGKKKSVLSASPSFGKYVMYNLKKKKIKTVQRLHPETISRLEEIIKENSLNNTNE